MKRLILILCSLSLFLCGCAHRQPMAAKSYTATFLTLFDTVTTIVGIEESQEVFSAQTQKIHDELMVYHQLFDIYHDYEGVTNLKTVNEQAGTAPVTVDPIIIELLMDCKAYYDLTGGRVNAAMGSVLELWHDARAAGIEDPAHAKLPDLEKLQEASVHTDMNLVVIDQEASTVFFADPKLRLDVGAIAKGWATQRAAKNAPEGMLISVGGNVCATGPKDGQGTPWVIGIQNPDGSGDNIHTIYVSEGSVVTSGDYQRSYVVDGKAYHHIIDPDTCMPAAYWCSVSVVCGDSGLGDALSTALFLLPLEEGKALVDSCGAEAFWIHEDGSEYMTDGFEKMIRT